MSEAVVPTAAEQPAAGHTAEAAKSARNKSAKSRGKAKQSQAKAKQTKEPTSADQGKEDVDTAAAGKKQASASAKKKNARRKKNKADKEASRTADGAGSESAPTIKLKVVVRRLPPNLPEAVFWQSIAPWAIRKDDKVKEGQGSTDSAPNPVGDAPVTIDQSYFVPGKLKETTRTGTLQSAEPETSSLHTFSRAYLRFRNAQDLVEFHRGYDGHLYRDAKGNEFRAVVEFAPFQRMPNDSAPRRKRVDALQGTIEDDDEYKAFLQSLEEKDEDGTDDKGQSKAEKTEAQLLTQLNLSAEASQANSKQAKSTPLLEHLRQQRIAKAESAASKHARGHANKAHGAANGSPAIPTGPAAVTKGKGKKKSTSNAEGAPQAKSAQSKNTSTTDPSIPTGPKAMRKESTADAATNNSSSKKGKAASSSTKGAEESKPAKGKRERSRGKAQGKSDPSTKSEEHPAAVAILKRDAGGTDAAAATTTTNELRPSQRQGQNRGDSAAPPKSTSAIAAAESTSGGATTKGQNKPKSAPRNRQSKGRGGGAAAVGGGDVQSGGGPKADGGRDDGGGSAVRE